MKKFLSWTAYLLVWIIFWAVLDTVGNFSIFSSWQGWAVIGLVALINILQRKL